ncbi:PREDICTED: pre-rRNA processing protein FTSJ3 [Cyphomyrmex costatus]|uniref:Putative rRNA methyltransferase n=1 Tax=Cyphomyrmex costatus TaxID=456900 RepID=A0A151I7Y1_9HYME|nr:PREDICTED: pre-rRNA processing protein FTSJ3 [Cyphomyrmex costatus]KYM94299.1 Putative rRNA methyltransferase 3 [Cyphomyrmex costatus]
MGKKSKIGKQRKDKYYQLAKETGYRSRAAFKLIQLNRKYEFLQKSRVCVDLCAAPGGWMQVARQNMPMSSIVIGVDLFPIKPIPGCLSLVEDITTDKCRVAISRELKTWKADVVLNDGAPNIGKNWLHDAYQQAILTLSAVKLATQFLKAGGWFVTKVFRSKDYNPLIWVLKQLFKKVHATKPQASRNESAEIFVVCQYYIAPDKLDPKFFDPKHVFSELEIETAKKLNVLYPEKQKKSKAEGYAENDYTLYHQISAKEFIACEDAVAALQNASEIVIDDEIIDKHEKTTKEVRECCKDIKVLGRKDLKLLLSWWKALKNAQTETNEEKNVTKNEITPTPATISLEEQEDLEDEAIQKQIAVLREEETKELKRKKKKANKERQKLNERLNMKMIHKNDEGPKLERDDLFNLNQIQTHQQLQQVTDQIPDIVAESDADSDEEIKPKMIYYEKDTNHLDSKGLYYASEHSEESDTDVSDDGSEKSGLGLDESEDDTTNKPQKKQQFKDPASNPLLTDLDFRNKETKMAHKVALWFEKAAFKNLENEDDADYELDKMIERYEKEGRHVLGEEKKMQAKVNEKKEKKRKISENDDINSDYDMEEMMASNKKKKKIGGKDFGFEIVPRETDKKSTKKKLTSEDLALGSLLIESKKSRRDLIDSAWNRYAFNDEKLPDWFVKDEEKHMKKEVPVPKELADDYKKRVEDLNVRPIKKVMEAKARKKKRAIHKLQKAKKKVEALMDNVDINDKEKIRRVKALYKKARQEPKKEIKYVVAKKHTAQKRAVRPPGVKDRYKIVDPRMKKDSRAAKIKNGKTKRHGKKMRRNIQEKPKMPKNMKSKNTRISKNKKRKNTRMPKNMKRKRK